MPPKHVNWQHVDAEDGAGRGPDLHVSRIATTMPKWGVSETAALQDVVFPTGPRGRENSAAPASRFPPQVKAQAKPKARPEDPNCRHSAASSVRRTSSTMEMGIQAAEEMQEEQRGVADMYTEGEMSMQQELVLQSRFSTVNVKAAGSPLAVDPLVLAKAQASFGVTTIVGCLDTGRPQVLSYDLTLLTHLGGILNMWTRGTIFRDDYGLLWYFLVHFVSLAVCSGLVMAAVSDFESMNTQSIETLFRYVNFMVPLVLGLYLGLTLERWWALRVDAIGKLCDCAHDVTLQVGAFLPDDEEVTKHVRRWSMASVSMVMLAARGQTDLGHVISSQQLEEQEAESLGPISLAGRPMVMWAWIARLANESMNKCKGPRPHSNQVFLMLDICVKARDSIQRIYSYLQTPLPFAYVHCVGLLVDAMVCITTVKCSLVCVQAYNVEPANYQRIAYELVAFVVVPLFYHGLMSVSVEISDPFGDDMSDFPSTWFQHWHQEHLDAVLLGCREFPWREWELLSGQPQSPENKLIAAGGQYDAMVANKMDEDSAGVEAAANQAAGKIMKDATIEVTVFVKRALKGFAAELCTLQEEFERASEQRASDADFMLRKLEAKRIAGG